MAVLTTSLLNFWKFDFDPCQLVCTSWTDSTPSPVSPSPSRPMALYAQPTVLYDCFGCESRTRSLAPSPKCLARTCHLVGLQSKCMENSYPGIQAQVTISATLWAAALVGLQVEKSSRKGKRPRLESVFTEAEFLDTYGAAQLATVPFDPH